MKIRMTQTARGAVDGVTVVTYEAGRVYELGETTGAVDLALVFLRECWAEEVAEAKPAAADPEPVPDQPGEAEVADAEPPAEVKPAQPPARAGKRR